MCYRHDEMERKNTIDVKTLSSKDLQAEVTAWASAHLPIEADNLGKLREELYELELSPSDPGEIGDILIGLMVHASNHGIDVLEAAADKFEIVKTRSYKMQADGTCRHC